MAYVPSYSQVSYGGGSVSTSDGNGFGGSIDTAAGQYTVAGPGSYQYVPIKSYCSPTITATVWCRTAQDQGHSNSPAAIDDSGITQTFTVSPSKSGNAQKDVFGGSSCTVNGQPNQKTTKGLNMVDDAVWGSNTTCETAYKNLKQLGGTIASSCEPRNSAQSYLVSPQVTYQTWSNRSVASYSKSCPVNAQGLEAYGLSLAYTYNTTQTQTTLQTTHVGTNGYIYMIVKNSDGSWGLSAKGITLVPSQDLPSLVKITDTTTYSVNSATCLYPTESTTSKVCYWGATTNAQYYNGSALPGGTNSDTWASNSVDANGTITNNLPTSLPSSPTDSCFSDTASVGGHVAVNIPLNNCNKAQANYDPNKATCANSTKPLSYGSAGAYGFYKWGVSVRVTSACHATVQYSGNPVIASASYWHTPNIGTNGNGTSTVSPSCPLPVPFSSASGEASQSYGISHSGTALFGRIRLLHLLGRQRLR